jgi:6-pyruvoyl tetrahydropterin synthase and hypothetical protein
MKVCKQFSFDASHQLVGHFGKCANLHGHTYKVELAFTGPLHTEGSSEGMVVDFYHVKKYAGDIIDRLDHATLLRGNEPIALANAVSTKRVIFGFRTTAENMSKFLAWYLGKALQPYARLDFVRLWETPTGYAESDYYEIFTDEEVEQYYQVRFYDKHGYITVKELLENAKSV